MSRKQLTKNERIKVYNKYNGHCAYCGCNLEYKDMQVDHLTPLEAWDYGWAPKDLEPHDFQNLMPACRTCNHYKRGNNLETFRKMIEQIPVKLSKRVYIFKVGLSYGFFNNKPRKVIFYFENLSRRIL